MMMRRTQTGFTLVEMIMVIVITGIIGGIVAVFLKAPIQQYMDVGRRADMTDIADTALRRVTRDLRLALPNSVRVTGTCNDAATSTCFIEFLPAPSGGRYRAGAPGDPLDFTAADGSFDVLGPMPAVAVGDQVVVYNLGITGANAYAGNTLATHNRRAVSAVGAGSISISSANALPFESPGQRFHIVSTPVSYVCDGAGALWRYWGYAIQAAQTSTDTIAELDALVTPATATRGKARLATNVSGCRFSYDANVVAQRSGLVTMRLAITEENETVSLYNAAHVSNQP
ncbi:MAG: prepilin-type N-terminal cleavage/methylation domain-containing protein [Nitrosomonadales bacterium]|nr:prepilin-type N-terminal cleavage/methylation domain-containing protein [Nitrosomonadales bacterium]